MNDEESFQGLMDDEFLLDTNERYAEKELETLRPPSMSTFATQRMSKPDLPPVQSIAKQVTVTLTANSPECINAKRHKTDQSEKRETKTFKQEKSDLKKLKEPRKPKVAMFAT